MKTMTTSATLALRAARISQNLGSRAGRGFCQTRGVNPRLYRLACQLLAGHLD